MQKKKQKHNNMEKEFIKQGPSTTFSHVMNKTL